MISAMKKLALITAALALPHSCPVLAQEPAGPALWKVADEDTTIYLFGTIHVLPPGIEWFDGRIKEAFEASSEFVTEVDMVAARSARQGPPPQAFLPQGDQLRSLMTQSDRAEYEAALEELGIPPATFDRFDPWFTAINVGMVPILRSGYDPDSGVDWALTTMAEAKRKGALETLEFQLDMFDATPMEMQLFYLDRTIEQLPQASGKAEEMVKDWLDGDTEGLAEIVNAALSDPEAYDWLVARRNANWARWIDERLDRPGTIFMAVGAGHLAGRDSVQDLLSERGIETERLQ